MSSQLPSDYLRREQEALPELLLAGWLECWPPELRKFLQGCNVCDLKGRILLWVKQEPYALLYYIAHNEGRENKKRWVLAIMAALSATLSALMPLLFHEPRGWFSVLLTVVFSILAIAYLRKLFGWRARLARRYRRNKN